MQLTITGKNLEVTDWLREYVEKKIGRLDRYLPVIQDAACGVVSRKHPRSEG